MRRILRVAQRSVEIDDGIEISAGANPFVDFLAVGFGARAGMVIVGAGERRDGGAVNFDSLLVGALDDLLVAGFDARDQSVVVGLRRIFETREDADVVHSFKHNQVEDSGLGDDIVIEARDGAGADAVEQNAIAADALIEDADV